MWDDEYESYTMFTNKFGKKYYRRVVPENNGLPLMEIKFIKNNSGYHNEIVSFSKKVENFNFTEADLRIFIREIQSGNEDALLIFNSKVTTLVQKIRNGRGKNENLDYVQDIVLKHVLPYGKFENKQSPADMLSNIIKDAIRRTMSTDNKNNHNGNSYNVNLRLKSDVVLEEEAIVLEFAENFFETLIRKNMSYNDILEQTKDYNNFINFIGKSVNLKAFNKIESATGFSLESIVSIIYDYVYDECVRKLQEQGLFISSAQNACL